MPDIQQLIKKDQLSQFCKDEVEIDVNNKSQLPWKQREMFCLRRQWWPWKHPTQISCMGSITDLGVWLLCSEILYHFYTEASFPAMLPASDGTRQAYWGSPTPERPRTLLRWGFGLWTSISLAELYQNSIAF